MDTELDYNTACNAYENKDYTKAYELFYKLAMQSDVSCQMNVANMLLHGLGVEQNSDRAYEWFEQAAINEDKEAQYIYGWQCIEHENEEEGIKQISLSAEAGFLDAIHDLAGFYFHGAHGLEVDFSKASVYYEKAVFLGRKHALAHLFSSKKKELGKFKAFFYFMKNISSFSKAVRNS
ncbi:sel1 repeat family protein [Sulfurimonas sp. MAG313]|nr:tetratricopeptide repeat protein [Sulfurimonas sp. MAG313]MDF1881189.1 sel1 repeat family protein [Sulfurimonas sp. MAG313]